MATSSDDLNAPVRTEFIRAPPRPRQQGCCSAEWRPDEAGQAVQDRYLTDGPCLRALAMQDGQISTQDGIHALDGRTRPVDVALRLAARGSSAPGNDAGRLAWNTNARAPRRPRVDGLGACGRRPCRRLQRQRLISRATVAMRR